ncbi:hypothetical protein GCM10027047_01620 [Rhodococcus aerolatus]
MAGTTRYELVAQRWDEIISKHGEPLNFVRHVRGDLVDLTEVEAKRLLKAGAVVEPGSRERAAAEAARAQYEAALAALPDAVREQLTADGAASDGDDPAGGGADGRPGVNEAKAAWVAYAESQGVPTEEAEALTKADLVERFKA